MKFREAFLEAVERSKLSKADKAKLVELAEDSRRFNRVRLAATAHARMRGRAGMGAVDWSKLIDLLITLLPLILALFNK